MSNSGAARLSVAPSISSEVYTDAPPSYDEAIEDQAYQPPSQGFGNLNIHSPPTSPPYAIPRRPVPNRSGGHASPTSSRSGTSMQPSKIPTATHCLSHLKLLECFHRLREEIGGADGLFGLRNEYIPPSIEPTERAVVLAKLCEKRWEIYVTRATLRFQSYWRSLQSGSKMLNETDLRSREFIGSISRPAPIIHSPDTLPPIDILMVFHAFMLNPRNFYADCVRFGKTGVWAAGMPWDVIESAFRGPYGEYQPNDRARASFQQRTRHPWDNLDEPGTMPLRCPKCSVMMEVPWTTTDNKRTWASNDPGEDGNGYADRELRQDCQTCGLKTTHDVLRTQRFKADLRALFTQGIPMPGSFLTLDGLAATADKLAPGAGSYQMTFPNRLIKAGLGTILAQVCSVKDNPRSTMKDVLTTVNDALETPKMVRRARSSKAAPRPPSRQERLALRRMLSAYWDDSSYFSMDLVGAVIRQNSFTSKMHSIDWLHSPAASSTMNRLVSKYQNFVHIMASYPNQTAVPTLDVDLAWHTHQLSPASYQAYCLEQTNTFINHDDKIDENSLSTAFEWTSKTYQSIFNRIYSECACWYCEMIRESHAPPSPPSSPAPGKLSRLLKPKSSSGHSPSVSSSSDPLAQSYAQVLASTTPYSQGPHISTHNVTSSSVLDVDAHIALVVQTRRLDRAYEIACHKAEKAGRPHPSRDDGVLRWGNRVPPRDGFAPFMKDVCISEGLFVADPGCDGRASACLAEGPAGGDSLGGCVAMGQSKGGKGIAVGACGSCTGGFCGSDSGFGGCGGGGGGDGGGGGGDGGGGGG